MTPEERVLAFMDDVERRDHRALQSWFTDATEVWIPPRPLIRGSRRILAMFRAIFGRYAEIHWRVTAVHALGANRCVYLTDSWGALDRDVPYHTHVMTLIQFGDDGRILSLSDYFKDTASLQASPTSCGCRPQPLEAPPDLEA